MSEPVSVIADERDHFDAALLRMRGAFNVALRDVAELHDSSGPGGVLDEQFTAAYAEARRLWGDALLQRDVLRGP